MLPIENQYRQALLNLMAFGNAKPAHSSEGIERNVVSLFARMLRHNFADGFPIYSGKRVNWRWAIAEMLMFVQAKPISWLKEQGIGIWDAWDDGSPVHYHNMVQWAGSEELNQTVHMLKGFADKPFRKSWVVTGWNPTQVYGMAKALGNQSVALPCCHLLHQLLSPGPGLVDMFVLIRSNDMFLGNPFNVAQYGALHQMYVHCLNNLQSDVQYQPNELVFSIADYHYYDDQLEPIKQYLATAVPEETPKASLLIEQRGQKCLADFELSDFSLENYAPAKYISAPLFKAGGS